MASSSDCEHAPTYKSPEAFLIWTGTHEKAFPPSLVRFLGTAIPRLYTPNGYGLGGSQEHFAGVERDRRADRAIGVLDSPVHRQLPCSAAPKLLKTNINTTSFTVLPTTPPRSNVQT
ncbi:hypothetical protein EV421DRAFT_1914890 [Armillaria borealis]|uniref:Uncharacterized protein n=1 Tax=Armillaria borealis TaxID=47425 RepID=A0AA39IF31_9AGAR|nr:hypothetical protein EV421DRAFT_1914890 [Armillaria borealis]